MSFKPSPGHIKFFWKATFTATTELLFDNATCTLALIAAKDKVSSLTDKVKGTGHDLEINNMILKRLQIDNDILKKKFNIAYNRKKNAQNTLYSLWGS